MIAYAGSVDGLPWDPVLGEVDRGCVVPGFVDQHTHLPFVGWRADEFEARLRGVSYRELHGGDGGIFRSARMFAEASDEEVLAFSRALLDEMLTHGTTALELKTGYGLSVEQELRGARLARRLAADAPQTCTVTLLAAHAVPAGVERGDWVRTACDELIPEAAREGLADAVDVYVEDIAFSIDDLEAIASATRCGRAGAPRARRPARRLGCGRGGGSPRRPQRRPPEPLLPRRRRRARSERDRRRPAAGLDVLPSRDAGPCPGAPRGPRADRARDRLRTRARRPWSRCPR